MQKLVPAALLSALCMVTSALAADMVGMKMDGQATKEGATHLPTAKAIGTVKAMDRVKGSITIAHGAVPTISWPAMTMTFKIAPDIIGSIQVGKRVEFEFVVTGMEATITKIAEVK